MIIGGGPAGCSCAIKLSQLGITDVLVVEAGNYKKFQIGESLPPNCRPLLQKLELYQDFLQQNHDPCYGSVSYWGSNKRGYNDSIISPLGHGWHLDRQKFNHLLADKTQQRTANLITQCHFKQAEQTAQGYHISLEHADGTLLKVTADTVIDASGSHALFARSQHSQKQHDHPLICISALFQLDDKQQTVSRLTHLEACETGWWYAARLPENRLLLSFTSTAPIIKQRQLRNISTWFEQLQKTILITKQILQIHYQPDSFKIFNVPCFQLDKISGKNWIAIGDAASTYDPITSAGIMKSLNNGMMAAYAVQAQLQGDDSGFPRAEQSIKTDYRYYQKIRHHYYQAEQRWPNAEFWHLFHTHSTAPV